jgi:hypothetical protein
MQTSLTTGNACANKSILTDILEVAGSSAGGDFGYMDKSLFFIPSK